MLPKHAYILFFCFLLHLTRGIGQTVDLQSDYTGATQYLSPQGWTINAKQEGGIYYWITSKDAYDPASPSILVMAMPNTPGDPKSLIRQIVDPNFTNLKEIDSRLLSNDEGHLLMEGQTNNGPANLAAVMVRDVANNRLFISLFAASPDDYQSLGAEQLLYRCLSRPNPFLETNNTNPQSTSPSIGQASPGALVEDPIAEQFGAGINMQSQAVQQQILQSTTSFSINDLYGEWTQVMSTTTNNVYEESTSGRLIYGSYGYAHLLQLNPNGQYQLTYSYRNGPQNAADIVEQGSFRLIGTTLVLEATTYTGDFTVYGKKHPQQATSPGIRQFQLGMHPSLKYLVLLGKPFEYTIDSESDAGGNPVFQEGFYRTR
ncbi:MAG: hypothetical protein AAF798_05755 [Bacteroidota bacterium]